MNDHRPYQVESQLMISFKGAQYPKAVVTVPLIAGRSLQKVEQNQGCVANFSAVQRLQYTGHTYPAI